MAGFEELKRKVKGKTALVAVYGMGYVGLPLLAYITKAGYCAVGIDVSEEKIRKLRAGANPLPDLPEVDIAHLKRASGNKTVSFEKPGGFAAKPDVFIICVPTPMDDNKQPDLRALKSASASIGSAIAKGSLVINESTVSPGMTRKVIGKIIEERSGLAINKGFLLAASPERVDPGNTTMTLEKIPKLIGGASPEATEITAALYSSFLAKTVELSSPEAAEAAKVLENSYRALNIGFINEFAKYCDIVGLDVMEIINAAKTKWSFQAHYPSIGVGGHCIPKDPQYLIASGNEVSASFSTLQSALATNEGMPYYTYYRMAKASNELGIDLSKTKICVLGLSYKENTRDLRDSPALVFANYLKREGFDICVHDPLFSDPEIEGLGFVPLSKTDAAKVGVAAVGCFHNKIKEAFPAFINLRLIIDGKNAIMSKKVPVFGIGRSSK